MNREIKIRVWDGQKFWYPDNPFEAAFYTIDDDGVHFFCPKQKDDFIIDNIKNPIYQQYTDLKDEHGKEIYEGDLLRYSVNGRILKVQFLNGMFTCQGGYPLFDFVENGVSIVGNIFENPELLSK